MYIWLHARVQSCDQVCTHVYVCNAYASKQSCVCVCVCVLCVCVCMYACMHGCEHLCRLFTRFVYMTVRACNVKECMHAELSEHHVKCVARDMHTECAHQASGHMSHLVHRGYINSSSSSLLTWKSICDCVPHGLTVITHEFTWTAHPQNPTIVTTWELTQSLTPVRHACRLTCVYTTLIHPKAGFCLRAYVFVCVWSC